MPPGVGYNMGYNDIDPMADQGLGFRMLEHLPGVTASLMFAQGRGANTIMAGGGFMDYNKGAFGRDIGEKSIARRTNRHRLIDPSDSLTDRKAGQFLGKSRGSSIVANAAKGADDVMPMNFLGSSRVNHLSPRPRIFRRYHSLSVFSNASQTGAYTPFQASLGLGRLPFAQSRIKNFVGGALGDDYDVTSKTLGPGLFSAISASSRMDMLEARAVKKGSISPRLQRRLDKADRSIKVMAGMNAPELLAATADPGGLMNAGKSLTVGNVYGDNINRQGNRVYVKGGARIEYYDPKTGARTVASGNRLPVAALDAPIARAPVGGVCVVRGATGVPEVIGGGQYVGRSAVGVGTPVMTGQSAYNAAKAGQIGAAGAGISATQIGMRGDLLVSSLAGSTTQMYGGYFRTAMGFGQSLQGEAALAGRSKALKAITDLGVTDDVAEQILLSTRKGGQGIRAGFKAADISAKTVMANSAARNVMLARGAGLGLRTANVLGTVSLAYDLGKMAGEVVVSGINLARDAYKSVQGSINKPAFGMGYQDTEAAATSRARGVMAIQNSRLNARSVLGSEAGMMAAHFG